MSREYDTDEYKAARAELLANNPVCHWCKRAPATELDHLVEVDAGGSIQDGYVQSCRPCNARRGANHLAKKRATQQQKRQNFFNQKSETTPTPSFPLSGESVQDRHDFTLIEPLGVGVPCEQPRLETRVLPSESFGPLVVEWASRVLGVTYFPWQEHVLYKAFQHDADLRFVNSTVLLSTARQQGKSFLGAGVVGWCLSELPRIWGRPVRIMSAAQELDLATEVFRTLGDTIELWEESGLAKAVHAYGRNEVRMLDKSVWKVQAAKGYKHGGTWDVIWADEIWSIKPEVIFGAWGPAQVAVPSPMAFYVSTAGDESSKAFLQLREQALAAIDAGTHDGMYFAEFSLPPGADPLDQTYWGYANPSLGRSVTVKALEDRLARLDLGDFLRGHMNQWVSSAYSWLAPGEWDRAYTDEGCPSGGVLAVESTLDDSKYVGVRAQMAGDAVHVTVEFVAHTIPEMWRQIEQAMFDTSLRLAITPTLEIHTPEHLRRRTQTWGYAELLKYTGLVRAMIREGSLRHTGEEQLAEHVNRAVLVRAQGTVVISSQRSPGPIEMARCMVAAAAFVSRPEKRGKPSMGSAK